jgi:positive regulator of sigma E activity
MLHRMALRVLPSLALAVTEESVRRRKRLVMLVPGLAAFVIYCLTKQIIPLSDAVTLLAVSGAVSAAAAVWAYRMGRQSSLAQVWREDGLRRLAWLIGWVGFVYGVQLSLMVLALLKILAHYDFLQHPDGPAMMAIIIACTSVARDAFEIGHVRLLQRQGEPVVTFPDGASFRDMLGLRPGPIVRWALFPAFGCAVMAVALGTVHDLAVTGLVQLILVTLCAGSLSVWAYLAGAQQPGGWRAMMSAAGRRELLRYWWWPGLAFAATYYLSWAGLVFFVVQADVSGSLTRGAIAGAVAGMMAVYCYYLGYRRHVENQLRQIVPPSLLRCPFVMGILSRQPVSGQGGQPKAMSTVAPPTAVAGKHS